MRSALAKSLSLFLLCSFTTAATAQEPVVAPVLPAIPDGPDVHVAVEKGQAAPFAGHLFDPATATRWGNWLLLWKRRYVIDLQAERQVCAARATLANDRLVIEQQRNAAVLQTYRGQLELERKKNDQPWYRSFEMGVVVGTAATIGLVLVTGYSLKHLD